MSVVSNFKVEVSLDKGTKRCKISDDEDFVDYLDYEVYDDVESMKIKRKVLKPFKESDDDCLKNERSNESVALFGEESSEDDQKSNALSTTVATFKQKSSENVMSSIRKVLQKVQSFFKFDETNKSHDDFNRNGNKTTTNLDDDICTIDIPERMQIRSTPVSTVSEEELSKEAQWICDQAFQRKTISIQDFHLTVEAKNRARKSPEILSKIMIVLELMKNQHLEVPFIAFYRKECILPELNINDLWKIYKFDAEWYKLSRCREALLDVFRRMKIYQDTSVTQQSRLIEKDDIELLENADTMEQLKDFFENLMLHYADEISEAEKADGNYSVYRQAGLHNLAKKFGLTPKQFAKNLSCESQIYKVEKVATMPCVVALNYINEKFETAKKVLKAVQSMIAIQMSKEPIIREALRKLYFEKATISVKSTKKGIQLIGENHPIYTMKYLKDKPVNDLVGDQYLKLVMAQVERLITISFSELEDNYVERMKQLICINDSDKYVQEWNLLCSGSVEIALTKIVIPELQEELHSRLLFEAKDCVTRHCARKMYNWIKTAPYRCDYSNKEEDWDTTKGLRVMGVAYVPDYSVATFACIIGPNGECMDFLELPNLLKMKNSSWDKSMIASVLLAIKNMIVTKKPHVVAISGESSEALAIAQDFRKVISSLVTERRFPKIAVEIVDNEFAIVYSTSRKGAADFSGYPVVLRQAISVARRLQDPLVEFSQLCNRDDEILNLKFHKLQDQLSRDDLRDGICCEFVNRVNEVGVDVNKAVQIPYFSNLMQFVCGLGPRKAQYLLDILKREDRELENRQQLTTLCHMGPKLFANCAGFIKINTDNLSNNEQIRVKVLDASRVHPEYYDWAAKIVADALDYEFEESIVAVALKDIFESPERLEELDLVTYAEELQRQGFENKCITMFDIRSELTSRYKDLRIPYQSPTLNQLFGIFAKETPEDFYIGKLVEATITGVATGVVWLRLDNGISGYIHLNNLSDEHMANPKERVRIGSRIYCRIVQIETEKFCVEASSKGSVLTDKNSEWRLPKDKYYDFSAEAKDELLDERVQNIQQQLKQQMDAKHIITHRCFRNINFVDAEILMQTLQPGEVIIRPSSKGEGHLCLTWKVTDGVNQHIAVRDDSKRFWIGDEEYQNFDEIIARHINPMVVYASELLNFKYYKPQIMGMQDRAEIILREQKWKNPKGIPYIVSAIKSNPGKFMLSYLPRDQCRHNKITITPSSLKFGGYRFTRLKDLIYWFEEHCKDSIPEQITPTPSRVCQVTLDVKVKKINPEMRFKVDQNKPDSIVRSVSQVAHNPFYYSPMDRKLN